jgi:hypothetical protein
MSSRLGVSICLVVCGSGLALLAAANVSEVQADAFAQKLTALALRAAAPPEVAVPSRTRFTEAELNSWVTYRGQGLLPPGVTGMELTMVGAGMVRGAAQVDLAALGRETGAGASSPWSYLGGRIPVAVTGQLHTDDGLGRFELQTASVSGVPVPKALVADMLAYYSRTQDEPAGFRLDEPFPLPAGIRRIEIGQGQAVVVQ